MKRNAIYGACLFFAVLIFASRGIEWTTYTHPDEVPVAKWISDTHRDGYISDRLYPSGWFTLAQAKVKWEEMLLDINLRHKKWTKQDGKADVLVAHSFRRRGEVAQKYGSSISTGREFNVFLTALSSVVVFFACLSAGLHPLAALFAGLLLGLNPFVMEHSHYCETDMGLVFSFAVSLWILGVQKRTGAAWLYLPYAFVSGFTVSCKYTLAPLIVPVAIMPFLQKDKDGKRRWGRAGLMLLAGIGVFVGGFLLGTPAIIKMPDYFEKARAAFDSGPNPSSDNAGATARFVHSALIKVGSLIRELVKLGWVVVAFFALSLAFWFKKLYRRTVFNIPAFVGIILLFFLTRMPWIRNQELLPLLVLLTIASALPVDWAVRGSVEVAGGGKAGPFARQRWSAGAARLAVAAFALCALVCTFRNGMRMTSFFSLRETRVECQNWIASAVPFEKTVASDAYLGYVARGTGVDFVSAGRLEQNYPECLAEINTNSLNYYLRNASHITRSENRHPITRKLAPEVQTHVDRFKQDCRQLMSWGVGPGRFRPAFAQPDIELWWMPDGVGSNVTSELTADIPVWFARPTIFRFGGATLYCNGHVGPVGPDEAIQTVGKRRTVCFQRKERQWAVSRSVMGKDSAKIVWNSFASPRQAILPPGKACVFEFGSKGFYNAFSSSAMPGARIRMRGDDQNTLILTSCVDNPAEAAFLLRSNGEPEKALNLLKNETALSEAGKVEAFRAAAALGLPPTSEWRQAAEAAVANFDKAVGGDGRLPREAVTICGAPFGAVEDLSLLRLTREDVLPDRELPIFLPRGQYRIKILLVGVGVGKLSECPIFNVQNARFTDSEMTDNGELYLAGTLTLKRGARLRFNKDLPEELFVEPIGCRMIEITWDPGSLVAGEVNALKAELNHQKP